jgi:hypothetical protein
MDSKSTLIQLAIIAGVLYFIACGVYFYIWRTKNLARLDKVLHKIFYLKNLLTLWLNHIKNNKWIQKFRFFFVFQRSDPQNHSVNKPSSFLHTSIELGIIALWALWVGKAYLNLDPSVIPFGREYGNAIVYHHTWIRALQCGWCAVWNGSEAGGYPMLGVFASSTFHPLVIITTLLLGVTSGAKITLIVSLWVAGIAQWWLAHELRLGKAARIWSACIAVAAGHITGKMQSGSFWGVVAMAMISLIFASMIAVYREKGKKFTVLLGFIGASAMLSGNGYLQAGFLATIPSLLILLINSSGKIKKIWRDFLLAFVLACLLAAPLLIPVIHFGSNFQKNASLNFETAQSIKYLPLNLVIDDWSYYLNDGVLNKKPFPALYIIYIGWIPVILAIIGLFGYKRNDRPIAWYMALSILQIFLAASATSLKWVIDFIPQVAYLRFSSVISGLAVPLILGFMAYGIDYLLVIEWPTFRLQYQSEKISLSTRWVLIPLFFMSINSVYEFSKHLLYTYSQQENVIPILSALKTDDSQWVNPPYGEQYFMEPAIAMGLKISPGVQFWKWQGRRAPDPYLLASRAGSLKEELETIDTIGDIEIFKVPDRFYASIQTTGDEVIPCTAQGTGGLINVDCDSPSDGTLRIMENYFNGWQVWMDGQPVPLTMGQLWLTTKSPPGKHTFTFQYLPWDVPLGICLAIIGLIIAIRVWKSADKSEPPVNMLQ